VTGALSLVRGGLREARRFALAALLAAALLSIGPWAGSPWQTSAPFIARAASPSPSADAGDTRSAGEGPGIVGSPFVAIAGVLGIGLAAAAITLLYVRLSAPAASGAAASARPGDEKRSGSQPPPSRR
jgi:hypothetical protein